MALPQAYQTAFNSYKQGAEEDFGTSLKKFNALVNQYNLGKSRITSEPQGELFKNFQNQIMGERGRLEMKGADVATQTGENALQRALQEALQGREISSRENLAGQELALGRDRMNLDEAFRQKQFNFNKDSQLNFGEQLALSLTGAAGTLAGTYFGTKLATPKIPIK